MYTPKYFSVDELTRSSKAVAQGIDNTPGASEKSNLLELIEHVLDPTRAAWGRPIQVNSGYRCRKLNQLVGGATTSSHMSGQAADITVGGKAECWKLYTMIKEKNIPYTKIIFERNIRNSYWVHISYVAGSKTHQSFIYDPGTRKYKLDD